MTKFLLSIIALTGLIYLIARDTWHIILNTPSYEISVSFILFLTAQIVLLWILVQIKKPFGWWSKFCLWRQAKKQEKKENFVPEVLAAVVAHQYDKADTFIHQAQQLYGKTAKETLLIKALLTPQKETFEQLNAQESTKFAGLYGLIRQAKEQGNQEEIAALLAQIPKDQEKTGWVQQEKMQLALNNKDWAQALSLLEQNKKQLNKKVYQSHKAVLLLKLGKTKEAYQLMSDHPAIVLAYAQVNPKKAHKILEKAWKQNPNWPVYTALKQTLKTLPEKKQLKAILDLTRSTRDQRYSLLARADTDFDLGNYARAKENLEIYLQNYPLTRQVADMMAKIERTAWNHEEAAQTWEQKAIESEDDSLWLCTSCGHTAGSWQILCPHCNDFDSIILK